MKTIVLSNLKQVFETIMTLCNILQLRVLSHDKNIVVYSDLFNSKKIILLNKEYSEVIYHDYTNDVHVCYKINNSDKLFWDYYNRYENSNNIVSKLNEVIEQLEKDNSDLNNEIETTTKESIREIDYLNNCIETLKNHNIELNKANEQMNNKLAYYESEYQDIVIEQMDYLINRIETLKKEYNKKMTENYDLSDKIQSLQYDNDLYSNQLEKMNSKLAYYETEYMDIVAEKMQQYENRYNRLSEILQERLAKKNGEISQLVNIIHDRDLVIETMTKQKNHLYKTIRQMKKK